jgi:hypothetical protein
MQAQGTPAQGRRGELDALLSEPYVRLAHTLELGELQKDELKGALHPLVRIRLDPVATSRPPRTTRSTAYECDPSLGDQRAISPVVWRSFDVTLKFPEEY